MQNEFCCLRMAHEIELFEKKSVDYRNWPISSIWYQRDHRAYHIFQYTGDDHWGGGLLINYCPFCGAKLPEELDEIDMEPFLRKEYGWTDDDCWGHPMRELPPEFQTDEWWKKRGL